MKEDIKPWYQAFVGDVGIDTGAGSSKWLTPTVALPSQRRSPSFRRLCRPLHQHFIDTQCLPALACRPVQGSRGQDRTTHSRTYLRRLQTAFYFFKGFFGDKLHGHWLTKTRRSRRPRHEAQARPTRHRGEQVTWPIRPFVVRRS